MGRGTGSGAGHRTQQPPGGQAQGAAVRFSRFGGKRLKQISWEEWFKTFDERELVFLFQEHLKNGNQSNFFRLDSPRREAA